MIFNAGSFNKSRQGLLGLTLFILSVAGLFIGCGSEGVNVKPAPYKNSPIVEPTTELKSVEFESDPVVYLNSVVPDISIYQAAAEGAIEIVRQHILLQPPDYINTQNESGWTPLHFAYAKGQKKMARFLLENGANYEARNNLGQAPYDIVAHTRQ